MDYLKACSRAKAELQVILNDLNARPHERGNLSYLIRHAMSDIECIEKYIHNFGYREEDAPIGHVGYTLEQMGYEK